MGDRKQPTPPPTNQRKPAPPPAPPASVSLRRVSNEISEAHRTLDRFGVRREMRELVRRGPAQPGDYHTLTLSQRIEELHRNLS